MQAVFFLLLLLSFVLFFLHSFFLPSFIPSFIPSAFAILLSYSITALTPLPLFAACYNKHYLGNFCLIGTSII